MIYYFNDLESDIDEGITLIELLSLNKFNNEKIAVAINGEIVSKRDWDSTFINELDRIEIIRPTQGG